MVIFYDEVGGNVEGCAPLVSCLAIPGKPIEAKFFEVNPHTAHEFGIVHSPTAHELGILRSGYQLEARCTVYNTITTGL